MNRRNIGGLGGGDDLRQWYREIPLVTRSFISGTLLLGFLATFNLIAINKLLFVSELVRMKFQVWRLITPFLFSGKFSFNFAMHLMVMYENFKRYESNPFNTGAGGNSADFLYMIIICGGIQIIIAHYMNYFILSESILFTIMYVWSKRDPDALMSMFGFSLKGIYLPWVYVAIRLVMGSDIIMPLIGIAVGHVYYFTVQILPVKYNYTLIKTPKYCIDIVNYMNGTTSAGGAGGVQQVPTAGFPAPGRPGTGGGHQWGRGRVLGAE